MGDRAYVFTYALMKCALKDSNVTLPVCNWATDFSFESQKSCTISTVSFIYNERADIC